ncbi:hypothetical protein B6S44_04120 [Bosea sp. Tri-44]|nr:hypothetical protein B6S44_04120 [Bosea sp. Tri-44]
MRIEGIDSPKEPGVASDGLTQQPHCRDRLSRRRGALPGVPSFPRRLQRNQEDEMSHLGKAEREIRKIAYALWMEQGQPEGRDHQHWEAAKEIWNFRNRTTEVVDTGAEDELKVERARRREQELLS